MDILKDSIYVPLQIVIKKHIFNLYRFHFFLSRLWNVIRIFQRFRKGSFKRDFEKRVLKIFLVAHGPTWVACPPPL